MFNKCQLVNLKIKKKNDDVMLMWHNWSVVTINTTLHFLVIYRYRLKHKTKSQQSKIEF